MRLRNVLRTDLPASLVVFLVAVPLSLGIALASGAPVAAGLIAAVIGGVVAGALGGSALQVSGPAAGLTVVMAETISTFGWAVTCAITVVAGALQILLGLSRVARAALAISPAIVHGMLAGIGVTIVLGQLHVVLGGKAQSSALENIAELPGQIIGRHDLATVIGLLTIAILLIWPRLPKAVKRVPAPLAAITIATVVALLAHMEVPRVELPADLLNVHFGFQLPSGGWSGFVLAAVTIAVIASVESLLSAVAVDQLHTGPRSDLNRELVGQGAANMISGALGGLPVTGVIVRSSTNVAAGAKTRASAILHGVWVLVFVALLASVIQNIPLAALAGLLVHVGVKLVNPGHIRQVLSHGDLPSYLLTLVGVVVFDLLTGVLAGIVASVLLMLRRTIWSGVHVEQHEGTCRVVVEGALTFLSVPRLSKVLGAIPAAGTVRLELVVDFLDHAAFESLHTWQQAYELAGGTVEVDEIGHPWFGEGKAGRPTRTRLAAARAVPRALAPWSAWQAVEIGAAHLQPTRRGVTEFQRRAAPLLRDTLSGLAGGQQPHTLFVTCGDARIVPNLITTSGPGDLFTIRNIGNLVPPGQADPSINAAIEFAVGVLGVAEIVVCGHSSCGAMAALVDGPPAGPLADWLTHARSTVQRTDSVTLDGSLPDRAGDRLALQNVLQQLDHLRTYPLVAAGEQAGTLRLTGMYFDVGAAQVHLYDASEQRFQAVNGPLHPADPVRA